MFSRHYLFTAVFAVSSLLVSFSANAQYYTVDQVTSCNNAGANAAVGGLAGGIIGAVLGGPRHAITDGLIGAAVGATAGVALSCQQQSVYVQDMNAQLVRTDYWNPYESENTRFVLLQQGYNQFGQLCRTFHSEFATPGGWVGEEKTACMWNGRWWYGYHPQDIIRVGWHRPDPQPWCQEHIQYVGPRYFKEYYAPAPIVAGVQVDVWINARHQNRPGAQPLPPAVEPVVIARPQGPRPAPMRVEEQTTVVTKTEVLRPRAVIEEDRGRPHTHNVAQ